MKLSLVLIVFSLNTITVLGNNLAYPVMGVIV